MVKKLRSLLHEQFPLDLRVKIELLSRRRDISNKEKQEELFKLLRDFKVEGIVPLGPGTNRYAFKLSGFVIKVATDNDGKIDNFKEFKMSKRLFPYVTKTYEVSRNGTLLVAEYIQPFSSYGEMLSYADKIRAILKKLSSVYLIGDVGVTNKNFANWGLRIGSDEPVCLDFAYVYSVSSELFICRHCKANAMLAPNADFTALICQNPACGHSYLFEDIRRRIGNDVHKHEIGDLTEEGYELFESGVTTNLDPNRSNYLVRKKATKDPKDEIVEETIIPDDFVQIKKTEETKMAKMTKNVISNLASFYGAKMVRARVISEPVTISDSTLAFEGGIDDEDILDAVVLEDATPAYNFDAVTETEVESSEEESADETTEDTTEIEEIVGVDWNKLARKGKVIDDVDLPTEGGRIIMTDAIEVSEPEENFTITPKTAEQPVSFVTPVDEVPVQTQPVISADKPKEEIKSAAKSVAKPAPTKKNHEFDERFVNNIQQAISKLGRKISDEVYKDEVFDEVRPYIKNRRFLTGDFQKMSQNVIFIALANFCELECEKDESGKRTYSAGNMHGKGEPTLRFLERIWLNREVNSVDAKRMMEKYREIYPDFQGFQPEIRDELISRIIHKKEVDEIGAEILADYIMENWGAPVPKEEPAPDPEPADPVGEAVTETEVTEKESEAETSEADEPAFTTDMNGSITFTEEELDNSDELLEDSEPLHVEIWKEDDIDIIHIVSDDAFGQIRIPFYVSLDNINVDENAFSEGEGYWEWLKAMVPDLMFSTRDPNHWLKLNDEQDLDELSSFRFVVLSTHDNGEFIMGIYNFAGVRFIDEDDGEILTDDEEVYKKLALLFSDLPQSNMSHIRRSISEEDLIYTEDYIRSVISIEDDDSKETEEGTEIREKQEVALQALLSDEQDTAELAEKEAVSPKPVVKSAPLKPVPAPQKKKADTEPMVFQPIHRSSSN